MKITFCIVTKGLLTYLLGFCIGFILSMSLYGYMHNLDLKGYFNYSSWYYDREELNDPILVQEFSGSPTTHIKEVISVFPKGTASNPKLLCYLLVGPSTHALAFHVKATWGKRCDKLLFFSTKPDNALQPVVLQIKEGYSYLWDKSKHALEYLYKEYPNYDWYLKADDDTFIIVENLKLFLSHYSSSVPVYYGVKFKMLVKQGYMSGGGGYVYSQEALKRIVSIGLKMDDDTLCPSIRSTGAEDLNIGKCFEAVGVQAGDSYDSEGKPRFFSHNPESLFFKTDLINKWHWYWKYLERPHTLGPECCSQHMISFHEVSPRMMWALEMLLYHIKVHGPQTINYINS